MMKQILIIKGQMNAGKTHTAYLVYERLLQLAEESWFKWCIDYNWIPDLHKVDNRYYNQDNQMHDFMAILTINGEKVGFISAGDSEKDLEAALLEIDTQKIDYLICCTRSIHREGSTLQYLCVNCNQYFSEQTDVYTVDYADQMRDKEFNEHLVANQVVLRIKQLLNI